MQEIPARDATTNREQLPRRRWGWPIAFGAAVLTLVLTNLWWLYQVVDQAVTRSYHAREHEQTCGALRQALAVLPHVAAGRSAVVRAAQTSAPLETEPFEKEGETIVGALSFRFDAAGRLERVSTRWEPSSCEP